MEKIKTKKLYDSAIIPTHGSDLASGWDLHAFEVVPARDFDQTPNEDFTAFAVNPGERVFVRTGIAVELPPTDPLASYGWEAQVRPRSGSALKFGITVVNSPGTIDADYTGEIGIVLLNTGTRPFPILKGDRIAQLVFAPVFHYVELDPDISVSADGKAVRGGNGFGSTGKAAKK